MAPVASVVDSVKQDIVHAIRRLIRVPGFTAAAVIVLALGVGANAAIYALVDAVLLTPLPYSDPDRLVLVTHIPPQQTFRGVPRFPLSPANYIDWEQRQRVFTRMAALQRANMTLTGRGDPEHLSIGRVSSSFFDVLGIRMDLGRGFLQEEDAPGQNQVVVLSHALWITRFGSDRSIVGQTMVLDNVPYRIIGVVNAAQDGPISANAWVPLAWPPPARANRSGHSVEAFARLAPGVEVADALTALKAIAADLEREFPTDNKGWGATVDSLQEAYTDNFRLLLLVVFGAVSFVLLIACANAANLILVRSIAQRPEMALRLALGAGPWRVARYVLTESVVIGLASGALGLIVGAGGLELLTNLLADRLPRTLQVELGWNVFLFTMIVSLLAGVAAGLWPAMRLARASLVEAVKEGGDRGDSDASGSMVRSVLVVAEVALSLVLLIGAGLMLRTVWQLNAVDPGFDSRNVVAAGVSLPLTRYPRGEQRQQFFDDVLRRVSALPGVESAAVAMSLPMRRNNMGRNWPLTVLGRPPVAIAEQPNVQGNIVTPDYFRAMRIGLVRGRGFTDLDQSGTGSVAIVSEATVRLLWPNDDPIGQRIVLSFFPNDGREVVGVVRNVREDGLATEGSAAVYLPYTQVPAPAVNLVVRTRVAPATAVSPAMAAALRSVDPDRPLVDVASMDAIVARSLGNSRVTMILLVVFAGLALVLAAVGIYSVLAYSVRRRTREIGIRMALGSARSAVTRMVVKDAMRPTFIGITVGIVAAVALRQVLATVVFGVSATDPVTFGFVAGLFVVVALVASALPAYWASRIDPIITLRAE